jgi:hypothetical protein
VTAEPILDYVITTHAQFEMERRGLSEDVIRFVLTRPEQRVQVRSGREILQSRLTLGSQAQSNLVRVIVDSDRRPAEVVTVYQTSKIAKYWVT